MKKMKIILALFIVLYLITGCSGSNSSDANSDVPVIMLAGAEHLDVLLNGVYEDAGATATDGDNGDITDQILVGGDTVDTSTEGTYVITYNVIDTAGNYAKEVTRTVTVDYWPHSDPETQGMDSVTLSKLIDYIDEKNLAMDSVIVVRRGHIVLEAYPNPNYDKNTLHILNSATKSFSSALIGIALREGYISDVNQKMTDLFPSRNIQNMDEDGKKARVTLEHILTMTPGVEWDEWSTLYKTCDNDYVNALWCQEDPAQYLLDLPVINEPGSQWIYNGGTSHLLSALVASFSETDNTLDFARKFLFEPLGIKKYFWEDIDGDIHPGGGGLWLRPRDMAKFGYLYLKKGSWEGQQIIPVDFVNDSVKPHWEFDTNSGYGYQWWINFQEGVYIYSARGKNGQKIYFVPDLDLVVVFTADLLSTFWHKRMLYEYIIKACDKD